MEQKKLSKGLKAVIIIAALCGLALYLLVIPVCGEDIVYRYPEFSGWYLPWYIFLGITGVPCFAALFFGWKIAAGIGQDKSFTLVNAEYLKRVSRLFAGDAVFFFVGNVVLLFLGMNHPGAALCSLIFVFAGIAVSMTTSALSNLVRKAAVLQEQSDLTI